MDTGRHPEGIAGRLRDPDDRVKLLAIAAMLVDHVGLALLPGLPWLRIVGRLAMPLFCYGVAAGYARTRSPLRYAGRLALWALVSQPAYWAFAPNSFGAERANVLFTLLLGLGWLAWREREAFSAWAVLAALTVASLWTGADALSFTDYGVYGVGMVAVADAALVRARRPSPALAAVLLGGLMAGWIARAGAATGQLAAAAAPFWVSGLAALPERLSLPGRRWLYAFYPAHLLAIAALVRLLGLPVP